MKWCTLGRLATSVLVTVAATGLLLMWGGGHVALGAEPADDVTGCFCCPQGQPGPVNPCAGRDPCEGLCLEVGGGNVTAGGCVLKAGVCTCVPGWVTPLNPCAGKDPCEGPCLEVKKDPKTGKERVVGGVCVEEQQCVEGVGGTTQLLVGGSGSPASAAEDSGSSSPPYAAIGGAAAAAAVALAASGWYARRRLS